MPVMWTTFWVVRALSKGVFAYLFGLDINAGIISAFIHISILFIALGVGNLFAAIFNMLFLRIGILHLDELDEYVFSSPLTCRILRFVQSRMGPNDPK
jgi:hypothetical protein